MIIMGDRHTAHAEQGDEGDDDGRVQRSTDTVFQGRSSRSRARAATPQWHSHDSGDAPTRNAR